jgi:transposase
MTRFAAMRGAGAGNTRARRRPLSCRCRSPQARPTSSTGATIVLVSSVTVTVEVAHGLCHSRMIFCRAYSRETQEMVFDAHERAFAFFRGACMLWLKWQRSSSSLVKLSLPIISTTHAARRYQVARFALSIHP